MRGDYGDSSGRHARNTTGLANRFRLDLAQALTYFSGQAGDPIVSEPDGNREVLEASAALDHRRLFLQVPVKAQSCRQADPVDFSSGLVVAELQAEPSCDGDIQIASRATERGCSRFPICPTGCGLVNRT